MKNNVTKKLLAALLCIVMIFSVVSCSSQNTATTDTSTNAESTTAETTESSETESTESSALENEDSEFPVNGATKIIPQTKQLRQTAETSQDFLVAYYEDCPEILLIDTDTMCAEFFDALLSKEGTTYTYEETDTTLTIIRSNGASCVIDFVEDTIYFNNFDLFNTVRSDAMSDLLSSQYVDKEGNSVYFSKTDSLDIAGLPILIDLAERNIPLDIYEGEKYIPLQTFNDIFLSLYSQNIVYNGKDLFLISGGVLDDSLKDEYYSIEVTERSEALADYTANEICLLLDLFYGLQDEHGVLVDFETFFEHIGLWDDLTSPDAGKASSALLSLATGYLADKHTSFVMASPYTGSSEPNAESLKVNSTYRNYIMYDQKIKAERAAMMPEGVPGYEEVGNTAYVTFDAFTFDPATRHNGYGENAAQPVDTIGLIIYAHSMITRENSPIENVVLDISCNGGGAIDSAVYVVAWMLGGCDLHLTNPITNSFSTSSYQVDVNLDGEFDANDTISDKNLYCLISPVSFSCGNLVPALLKESGMVTLLGGTSGGGACAVQHVSTADGNLLTISSPHRISVVSNGAYYTVDQGIDPHHHFSKFESYFNRESLTEYINDLK